MNPQILLGDCLEVLAGLPSDSVDCCVTDPPYGLGNTSPAQYVEALTQWAQGNRAFVPSTKAGFMGKDWDSFVPPPAVWDEVYRVLKPGGHAFVFAGTRTIGIMETALRFAGFDVRDSIAWLYGSGFPKSLDVSKAIDKAARGHPQGAADPTSPNHGKYRTSKTEGKRWNGDSGQSYGAGGSGFLADTVSGKTTANDTSTTAETSAVAVESDPKITPAVIATDEAKKWEGWGTALKPAFEPILVVRKPLVSTVAHNVTTWGTGALNIDATRIGVSADDDIHAKNPHTKGGFGHGNASVYGDSAGADAYNPAAGRWPANVVLDDTTAPLLDQQTGTLKSGSRKAGNYRGLGYMGSEATDYPEVSGDEGGASRFFKVIEADPPFLYAAKAPKRERPSYVAEDGETIQHETVKPLALMRWICRLGCRPGGTIIDPFGGSGTTAEAAILEGMTPIIIEQHEPYHPLIRIRVDRATEEKESTLL